MSALSSQWNPKGSMRSRLQPVFAHKRIMLPVFGGISKSMLQLDVNWASHLKQHDLLWNSIPKDYFAGAYVGNGLLGTILFKDDSDQRN